MCIVPFKSNDIAICVTGCTKYAQYVKRLSGSIKRSDNSLSIGLARPHLHDSTIHTSAKPQADHRIKIIINFFGSIEIYMQK